MEEEEGGGQVKNGPMTELAADQLTTPKKRKLSEADSDPELTPRRLTRQQAKLDQMPPVLEPQVGPDSRHGQSTEGEMDEEDVKPDKELLDMMLEEAKKEQQRDELKQVAASGDKRLKKLYAIIVELEAEVKKVKEQYEQMQEQAVEEKRKTWCRHCLEPARYNCCSNVFYCGQDCYNDDWPNHFTVCKRQYEQIMDVNQPIWFGYGID